MVVVRALSADDWQVTKQLRLAALLDAPGAFGGTFEQTAQRTEPEWRTWPAGGQPFAAYAGDEPVGLVCAVPSADPDKTYLISMWVSPHARGMRIGRQLVDAVTRWARARGGKGVELDVYEHNHHAYRAYVKAGFETIGPSPDHPGAIRMLLTLS